MVEDNAGWHRSKKAIIPSGIEIDFLPPYSPELQPAERLWQLVDEPLINQYFETINWILSFAYQLMKCDLLKHDCRGVISSLLFGKFLRRVCQA